MAGDKIEVIVEIPRGSRNKYEYDHDSGAIRLDRRLYTAMAYPADYGFVPTTLGGDGDPLDALIILDEPTFPGCHVDVRIVGVYFMVDESGPDAKLLCVLHGDARWEHVKDLEDLSPHLREEIAHFFRVYKDLEPNKSAEPGYFEGRDAAVKELNECFERFTTTH